MFAVFPLGFHSNVSLTLPFIFYLAQSFKGRIELESMVFSGILKPKVVHYKDKVDRLLFVGPKIGSDGSWGVSIRF